jgi:hypothetical protein
MSLDPDPGGGGGHPTVFTFYLERRISETLLNFQTILIIFYFVISYVKQCFYFFLSVNIEL